MLKMIRMLIILATKYAYIILNKRVRGRLTWIYAKLSQNQLKRQSNQFKHKCVAPPPKKNNNLSLSFSKACKERWSVRLSNTIHATKTPGDARR